MKQTLNTYQLGDMGCDLKSNRKYVANSDLSALRDGCIKRPFLQTYPVSPGM